MRWGANDRLFKTAFAAALQPSVVIVIHQPTSTEEQRQQLQKWLGGVVLAIVLAVYGGSVLFAGHARIRLRRGVFTRSTIELDGLDARLYGVALIVGALALHSGLFWRSDERYWRYGEIGLAVTGLTCAVLTLWLLARQFINFV